MKELPKCLKFELTDDDGTSEQAHLDLVTGEDETGHYAGISSAGDQIDILHCAGEVHSYYVNGKKIK